MLNVPVSTYRITFLFDTADAPVEELKKEVPCEEMFYSGWYSLSGTDPTLEKVHDGPMTKEESGCSNA
jgi:hypothetical protein